MTRPVRLRIDVAYDGGPFHGFARQRGSEGRDRLETVQGTLERALSRLLGQPADTTAAGRTDRGVHALGQVVHLDVDATVPRAARVLGDLDDLRARLDQLAGDAVTVWAVRRVSSAFDARRTARERRYRYRLGDAPALDPLERHRVWHVAGPLRLAAMRAGAGHLVGEHDFSSFCRRVPGGHRTRTLHGVTVARRGSQVHLRFRGAGFCQQQVRSMVGCLVDVGRGVRPPDWIAEVLAARDRSVAAVVAPPHGLVLEGISYGRGWPAAPPPAARAG